MSNHSINQYPELLDSSPKMSKQRTSKTITMKNSKEIRESSRARDLIDIEEMYSDQRKSGISNIPSIVNGDFNHEREQFADPIFEKIQIRPASMAQQMKMTPNGDFF